MHNSRLMYILFILLILGLIISLIIGPLPLSILFNDHDLLWTVIEILRLPRTLLALLTGGMLGLTGAVLQGFFRNPLADAGILGVSAASSFGSVLALTLGVSFFYVPFWGVLSATVLMGLMYRMLSKNSNTLTLILIGLAFNSLFGALTALTLNLSTNPYKSLEIMFWLLGSFSNQPLQNILFIIPFLTIGVVLLWEYRSILDALTLGEDMALTFGHSLKHSTQILVIATALCIGPLAALGGTIGFVGLITPHVLRHFIRSHPSNLLLPSAVGGAILCLFSDIVIRLLPTHAEIKIGVITSLLGVPFFLSLILTNKDYRHDSF